MERKVVRKFSIWKNHESGNVVVRNLKGHKLLLNRGAARIWHLIDDNRSGREILEMMQRESNCATEEEMEEVRKGVSEFLGDLTARGLITCEDRHLWTADNNPEVSWSGDMP
jgi:hypothetical protein